MRVFFPSHFHLLSYYLFHPSLCVSLLLLGSIPARAVFNLSFSFPFFFNSLLYSPSTSLASCFFFFLPSATGCSYVPGMNLGEARGGVGGGLSLVFHKIIYYIAFFKLIIVITPSTAETFSHRSSLS